MLASQNELAPRKRRNEQTTIHKEYAHPTAQTSPLWIVAVQGQFWEWWVCDDVQDMRILAVWSFCKNVRKDDVMLFVHAGEIEGYYVVTGDHVECRNEEDFCLHSWEAETIRFSRPVCIESRFGSPFFKMIGNFKKEIVSALTQIGH